jgi:serine/threonine-protein kinase RsbW
MAAVLTVPGRYDQLEAISHFVGEQAVLAELAQEGRNHVQLAVDEACTNIIEHGYRGEDRGKIRITCMAEPGRLMIEIRDNAPRFDFVAREPDPSTPDSHLPDIEALPIGGLGLRLITSVMDHVAWYYRDGGNTLLLIKTQR